MFRTEKLTDMENRIKTQKTVNKSFVLEGTGIHTGQKCRMEIHPAPVGTGIVFLKNGVEIKAGVENVVSCTRCTTIGKDGVVVNTIEHLLSACHAFGIDNLKVEASGDEMPIYDGSALPFAKALQDAGISCQGIEKQIAEIRESFFVKDGDSMVLGMPADNFSAACTTDYNHPFAGVQSAFFGDNPDDYIKNVAPARTFGFYEEVKALIERSLALGGSLDNALIIKQDGYMNPPRFPDEIVRHKLLDLIGDLALANACIKGHVYAVKPSHKLNVKFVETMLSKCSL
ncbi:MAG: UDP-3-O-acyl-N-acetylglucosamine deacetylase [Firmicutes bacterium]|nr:UDP-3-O-acyl-N-acetylglucosamine deacetylase [Bacillota bacterium]